MNYLYYTCDVFTDKRFSGNPLAVLPNASGLTPRQMQLIAREFNFSETAFVFPAEQGFTRSVRIFTASQEVPFAGHPNIGTAFVLASSGELGDIGEETQITFEEQAGLVPITVRRLPVNRWWCELQAPQPLSLGKTLPVDQIAKILSLAPNEIIVTTHSSQRASVGLPFIIIELKDRTALENIAINIPAVQQLIALDIQPFIYVYTHDSQGFDIQGRMLAFTDSLVEDLATGSANCALAAMLVHYDHRDDCEISWRIAQGVEMNRPSILNARAEKRYGTVTGVWIGGESVLVSQGFINVV